MSLSKHKILSKGFTVLTSVTTVLSLSGVAYLAPVASAVTPADFGLTEGNTVSVDGLPTGDPLFDPDIYIVNDWGYKRLFLNPAIFNFYGHLGGFAAVKKVSPATRDAFGTSGLFRNCEAGSSWNNGRVYGVEVTGEDVGLLHWVNTTGAQAVQDDPNFFLKVFCINDNEFNWYTNGGTRFGADYTSVNQVPQYNRTSQITPSGSVSVSLASDNPAPGTIVNGQARYDLAHFMFSGSGAVKSLKFRRVGVSADATLTNVYLYQGTTRLTDSATVSSGVITFNDAVALFNVAGSANISVQADVNGSAGETVGVELYEMNGAAVGPYRGNMHTIATVANLATVAFGASTTPSTATTVDPANDVVAWQNTLTVGNRYVWLKSLQFRTVGSVLTGDLRNYRLFVDGVAVGSAVAQADANGYVVFNMSGAPVKLETGSRVVKVMLDVVGGSGRNFFLSVRQASDIWAVDSQYNAGVLATDAGDGFPVDTAVQTVSSGTLTVTKRTDSPAGDVVKDGSGVVLARFDFKAQGERMKVENLRVNFTAGNDSNLEALRNGALYADGVQVGSTATIWEDSTTGSNSTAYTQFNLGSSLIVEPGVVRVVEIRADIFDSNGVNDITAADTITANIIAGASNVQRLTSLNYVSSSAASGNQMTVATGSLSAGKYSGYANQSVVTPKTGVKLGHFTIAAASSENVNVNTIDIGFNGTNSGSVASKTLDVYIKVWNDTGSLIYTSPVKSTVSATASSSYSVNISLPMSKTYQVEVWGNLDTVATAGKTLQLEFSATGVAASSGTSSTTSVVLGQVITTATGSLTQANGSFPAAQFRAGGTTATGYQFTLTPAFDDFTLDEVYVDLSSALASSTGAVANLMLKDGATTLATATVNTSTGSASFTGLNLSLPAASGTKTLTVDVTFSNVGVGFNDTAGNVTVRLDGMKYRSSAGSITTTNGLATTNGGNANVVVKAFPSFANQALPTTVLNDGTQTLFKTTVSSNGGQVVWRNIMFTATQSGVTISGYKLFEDGSDITSLASVSALSGSRYEFTFSSDRVVSGTRTLEFKATVALTAAGDSIVTSIANPAGNTVTSEDYTTHDDNTDTFVWSDSSSAAHSTSTDDWFDDGLVKALGESQTLSK